MSIAPSASYSLTVRVSVTNRPGMLSQVASAIGAAGGDIGAVDLVESPRERVIRDLTIKARDIVHAQEIVGGLKRLPGARVINVSDRTFLMHLGGKIEIHNKVPICTRDDLSMAHTPGAARVCLAIHEDVRRAFSLTIKQNAVAVVIDGTAVLRRPRPRRHRPRGGTAGHGRQGDALQGVRERRRLPDLPGHDGARQDRRDGEADRAGLRGRELEDIAAPRCFEIEEQLRKELDIPVFHDDQHGTAVVALAALLNALRIVRKDLKRIRVVVPGVGAAGTATIKILLSSGVGQIIGVDAHGTIHRGRRKGMDYMKSWVATATNPKNLRGGLGDALDGADVFIGLSVPGVLTVSDIRRMARDPVVFAMANPVPEIQPDEAEEHVRVMATGRSDYPNQINNVLCFPGFFRGLLDSRARSVNDEMKVAAAGAIAAAVSRDELSEEYIIPSVSNKAVAPAVAREVARAAQRTGVARRGRPRGVAGF